MSEIVGRYALVQGHRLYYETAGEGADVVCIHTSGQSGLQWRFVLPYLAERGYRCTAVDLPGHGKSFAKDFRPLISIRAQARRSLGALPAERPSPSVMLGCSIGADIALDLGAQHPEVRGVIACDGAAHNPPCPAGGVRLLMEDSTTRRRAIRPSTIRSAPAARGPAGASAGSRLDGALARSKGAGERPCGLECTRPPRRTGAVRCPVLLVRGEEDFLGTAPLMQATRRRLADAEYVELPGIGHFPHMESPELPALVYDFLRRRGL